MTTNIPAEALTGCECLVWSSDFDTEPEFARYNKSTGRWSCGGAFRSWPVSLPVYRAIPLSWCLAAPEMREALKEMLFAYQNKDEDVPHKFEVDAVATATSALAKCDGKGEKNDG